MCEFNNNGDGTYSFTKLIDFTDGNRIITINGNKMDSRLTVEITISPSLSGKIVYKCNRIYVKEMIEDGKVRITDKDIFHEYPFEIVNSIEYFLNEFLNKLMVVSNEK